MANIPLSGSDAGGTWSAGVRQQLPGFSPTTKQTQAMARVATLVTDIGQTWGAGAISTGPGNKSYRSTDPISGLITTVIMVDLTALGGKGGHADDVIGLPAGGAAYVYRNVVADNGIIFKYEISCTELPAAASGAATADIDFCWNASAVLAYDGACGTSEVDVGGLAAGATTMIDAPSLTANDYLYLTEGDTAATDGVYNAGQFVITLYATLI